MSPGRRSGLRTSAPWHALETGPGRHGAWPRRRSASDPTRWLTGYMVAPRPKPDPITDPDEPVPDDPAELLPDAPEPLPPAPVESTPDDPGGDTGGVPEPA